MSCELCGSPENLRTYSLAPATLTLCGRCDEAISKHDLSDTHHWQCLHETVWSESTPVKVLTWRLLQQLLPAPWAQDLLDQLILEEEDLKWAQAGLTEEGPTKGAPSTVDSNGAVLLEGDSVTLIKDLDVKGGGFTAKRGTLVKNIRLTENPEHIEARVNGIHIVLLTKFLKKA